jgi:hypothetical protein
MRWIFLLLISGLYFSCSTTKNLKSLSLYPRTKSELYTALENRNIDFQWFTGKASTSYESPEEGISGSIDIRMRKDSIVWVAAKKLGIEAVRVLIDAHEYTVLNRIMGEYQKGSTSEINTIIPVVASFEDMQQLIFGNVILPDSSRMSIEHDSVYHVISWVDEGMHFRYYLHSHSLALERISITDRARRTSTASYSDYRNIVGFGMIPYERIFTFPYDSEGNTTMSFSFSEIAINEPKAIKFTIPNSYERVN